MFTLAEFKFLEPGIDNTRSRDAQESPVLARQRHSFGRGAAVRDSLQTWHHVHAGNSWHYKWPIGHQPAGRDRTYS